MKKFADNTGACGLSMFMRMHSYKSSIGRGLVRPFDRLRAVTVRLRSLSLSKGAEGSEVEPQAHYKSATYRKWSLGFVFCLDTIPPKADLPLAENDNELR